MVDEVFKGPAPDFREPEDIFNIGEIAIPLPSQGELYEENHPLHMKDSVNIKPMTTEQEDILNTTSFVSQGTMVDRLLVSSLKNKSIDPGDLFIGDKNAILLGIRISGFGPEYSTNVKCPSCKKSYRSDFMLDQLMTQELQISDKVKKVGRNLFETVLPFSKIPVTFKLLTQREEDEITQTQENRRKALKRAKMPIPEVNTTNSDKLIKSLVSVNGNSKADYINKFVRAMRPKDSRYLRNLRVDIEPKVLMLQDSQCPHCLKVEEEKHIPLTIDFFWPEEID